jgi:hypothetical protein
MACLSGSSSRALRSAVLADADGCCRPSHRFAGTSAEHSDGPSRTAGDLEPVGDLAAERSAQQPVSDVSITPAARAECGSDETCVHDGRNVRRPPDRRYRDAERDALRMRDNSTAAGSSTQSSQGLAPESATVGGYGRTGGLVEPRPRPSGERRPGRAAPSATFGPPQRALPKCLRPSGYVRSPSDDRNSGA